MFNQTIPCYIPPPKPIKEISQPIKKAEALVRAEIALEELEYVEYTTPDWTFSYFHNQNITQHFPLHSYDLDSLSKEEIELISNYKFILGYFESSPPASMFMNSENTYSLKRIYMDGDVCDNGSKRTVIINYTCGSVDKITSVVEYSVCKYLVRIQTVKLCSIPYFQPFRAKDRSPIYCKSDFVTGDTLLVHVL